MKELKAHIREKLNLWTCEDSSTDTKMDRNRQKGTMSHVTCHVSHVTCHLSLTLTPAAKDLPLANLPIMHSRLVCKDQKKNIFFKSSKQQKPKTANITDTLFDLKSPVHRKAGFPRWTHTNTRHTSHRHLNFKTELAELVRLSENTFAVGRFPSMRWVGSSNCSN